MARFLTKPLARAALSAGFLAGCAAEATPGQQLEELAEVTTLRIEGYVTIGRSDATDVRVTGHCGQERYEAETDQGGRYAFDIDLEGCDQLTIEHDKEGFLPRYAVVPIPPPASPISLELDLEEMELLECGMEACHTPSGANLPTHDVIARGFQLSLSGSDAPEHVPPELRTADGELISFLGFHYLEFRDVDGAELAEVPEMNVCSRVTQEALSWVGDVDPSTDTIELDWYRYDVAAARWEQSPDLAYLKYERGNAFERDDNGACVTLRDDLGKPYKERIDLLRDVLADARAEEHHVPDPCSNTVPPRLKTIRSYWICGPMDRSGFYAFGVTIPQTSCYTLYATDACGEPLQSVSLVATGTDHGFRAQSWTGPDGKACVDVMASEPVGEDFDLDGLGGETFWVDLEVRNTASRSTASIDMHENERVSGTCEEPESCIALRTEFRGCED